MSKGNPIVTFRCPPEVLAEMQRLFDRTADTRKAGPWTRSEFIVRAIVEKLCHIHRSNRKNRKARGVSLVGRGGSLRQFLSGVVKKLESQSQEAECSGTSSGSTPDAATENPSSSAMCG